PAVAVEPTVFACVTEPPSPGLSTRTGDASFEAPCWSANEPASAPCSVEASCPATWMPVPPCDCDASCVVVAALPAVAAEFTAFVWDTEPPSPGLSTRIETAVFDGWSWTAPDAAPAVWPVSADCFAVWTPVPLQPHG